MYPALCGSDATGDSHGRARGRGRGVTPHQQTYTTSVFPKKVFRGISARAGGATTCARKHSPLAVSAARTRQQTCDRLGSPTKHPVVHKKKRFTGIYT